MPVVESPALDHVDAMILRFVRLLVVAILSLSILGRSTLPPGDFTAQIRTYTRPVEFDYVSWTVDALRLKWLQLALGEQRFIAGTRQPQVVLEYLELVRQTRSLESQMASFYSDPSISDPETASLETKKQLDVLSQRRTDLAALAESVFQSQLSAVLADLGLSLGGQPLPPVLYHVTPPPLALIVSPRQEIRQEENISITPELTLEQMIALEDQVAGDLDVSALVVNIGGVGVYPTMVMQTTDVNYLAEVVAHEWVHNFLTIRPLGLNYLSSPELRTFNETVASIAGKEIGRLLVERYYPQYLPPPPPDEKDLPEDTQEPPAFDYRAEMRKTRLNAEKLLSAGEVDKAELYMELRRRFFWDNGYRIRKLNQAYFAFYGAYADVAGGAAGEDPVGAAVRAFWSQTSTIAEFVKRVSWMWSIEQLQREVETALQPGRSVTHWDASVQKAVSPRESGPSASLSEYKERRHTCINTGFYKLGRYYV